MKVIIKHEYDFFINNRLEDVIKRIPFQKLETQISEINKVGFIKMAHESQNFSLLIHPQGIQLTLQSLQDFFDVGLDILKVLSDKTKETIQLEFVSFNGILKNHDSNGLYNQSFNKDLSEKVKVKMLGLELQTKHFLYRVSLNKHMDFTKVNAKVLMQGNVHEFYSKIKDAFEELDEELKNLQQLL